MDRGRIIDNVQNVNAVNIDQYGKTGKTSTRVINPPGGKDHFSLGWGDNSEPEPQKPKFGRKRFEQNNNNDNQNPNQNINKGVHTSVKVSNRPGGQSNIVFGTDDTNYDHYRK